MQIRYREHLKYKQLDTNIDLFEVISVHRITRLLQKLFSVNSNGTEIIPINCNHVTLNFKLGMLLQI